MLVTIGSILFFVLCFFLAVFVLIQQGKGDMGFGSIARGSQAVFGGSGGQNFFERATWFMGILFMAGALGLTLLQVKQLETSRIGSGKPNMTPVDADKEVPSNEK